MTQKWRIPDVEHTASVKKKPKAIKIWCSLAMTGPVSTHYRAIWYGVDCYWKMVNEEEGGIEGVPVIVICHDNAGSAEKALTGYARRRVDPLVVCCTSSCSSFVHEPLKPKLLADDMPMVGACSEAANSPPSTEFSPFSDYCFHAEAYLKWFNDNWEKEGGTRPLKVGMIYQPIACMMDELAGLKYACNEYGIEFVGAEEVPVAPGEYTPELMRLRDKGANLIQLGTLASVCVPVLKDAYKLGISEAAGGPIKFNLGAYTSGESVIRDLAREAAEGLYGDYFGDFDPDTPGAKKMIAAGGKYYNWPRYGLGLAAGWWYQLVIHEAIKRAIKKVGIENLDRKAVLEALRGMKTFDPGPGLCGPLSFSSEKLIGGNTLSMIRIVGNKWVRYRKELLSLKYHKSAEYDPFRKR